MTHVTKIGCVMGFVAAVAVLVSAPAYAANPDRARLDINRDANLDGRITRDELGLTTNRLGGR